MGFNLLAFCIFLSLSGVAQVTDTADIFRLIDQRQFDPSTVLWYQTPAAAWESALPVGNGRLGAMVFGRADEERIQLNEDTYWTGGPYSTVVKGGYKELPEVRKLVFEGKYLQAQTEFGRYLMGYPVEQQKYQSLGNLHLFFTGQASISNYKRWLDLQTGVTGVRYTAGGVTFRREVFASAADQVIVIRLTADKPGSISFTTRLRGVRNQTHSNYATDYFRMDGWGQEGLVLTGKSADYMGVVGKLRYEARLKAVPEGGTMKVEDDLLTISGANIVTLYVVAATNFVNYHDVSADAHRRVEGYLAALSTKTFDSIRAAHIRDYRSLFARVSLHLPLTPVSYEPTDRRKAKVSDPGLAALAYQFGRYVLISSSRPGCQPANLQGIWNDNPNPMWDSKYTTNINTEMNYWPAETGNLSECAEPLFQMIGDLTDQGAQVAKEHYGCRGWVFHQNTDLWRVAAPMDGPTWGTFTVGGAWLCTHLWEHYAYTGDTVFLRKAYPLLKGSVQFFLDFLVPSADKQWLVTNPSSSPENFPDRTGNGRYFDEVIGAFLPGTNICAGSSIDMQVLTDLFQQYIRAAGILHTDPEIADSARDAMLHLLPPRIGKDGALQEWAEDWGQTEHPHRHLSPLYGLYPGNVFSFTRTPQLMDACRQLLLRRGDSSAEWARVWKVALWARLHDGNHANAVLNGYLRDASNPQFFGNQGFPVQVDGTLGATAAVSEMLIQSNDSLVELLPALPAGWGTGSYDGVCTRGAFEWNLQWDQGRIVHATLLSKQGRLCRLQAHADLRVTYQGKILHLRKLDKGVVEFATVKDGVYEMMAPGQPRAQYCLAHINIVDVESGRIIKDRTVYIKGNRITAISSGPDGRPGTLVYDCTGKYLMPGLWDMHIHDAGDDSSNRFEYVPLFLVNGVTGIRDMWGEPEMMNLKADIDAGRFVGPRMVIGSPIVEGDKPFWRGSLKATTKDRGRFLVDSLRQMGYDFIKIYSLVRDSVYFAIADECKRKNIPLEGHLPIEVGLEQAVDAGQRSYEHNFGINIFLTGNEPDKLRWAGQYLDTLHRPKNGSFMVNGEPLNVSESDFYLPSALRDKMIKNRVAIVPTLTITQGYGIGSEIMAGRTKGLEYLSAGFVNSWMKHTPEFPPELTRTFGAAAKFLADKGILILAGTDVNNPFCVAGFGLQQELINLHDAGLTNLQVLQSATLNPAKFLYLEKELGSVTTGKLADLLVLEDNPLAEVANTQQIDAVIVNGKYLSKEDLRQMLAAQKKR